MYIYKHTLLYNTNQTLTSMCMYILVLYGETLVKFECQCVHCTVQLLRVYDFNAARVSVNEHR